MSAHDDNKAREFLDRVSINLAEKREGGLTGTKTVTIALVIDMAKATM